jgi:hypothetical protein
VTLDQHIKCATFVIRSNFISAYSSSAVDLSILGAISAIYIYIGLELLEKGRTVNIITMNLKYHHTLVAVNKIVSAVKQGAQ